MVAAWWSVSSQAAEMISSLLLLVVMEDMEQLSRVWQAVVLSIGKSSLWVRSILAHYSAERKG